MTSGEIIVSAATIIAIIAGPILAVQAQKWIERVRQGRDEKRRLFLALMATRGRPLVAEHVQALNMIDVIFSGKGAQDLSVVEAWREYRAHLNDYPQQLAGKKLSEAEQAALQNKRDIWTSKSRDMLVELLVKMADLLGYHYDRPLLQKGAYTPQGYQDDDFSQFLIRRGLIEILGGIRPVEVRLVESPSAGDAGNPQAALPETAGENNKSQNDSS